MTPEDKTFIDTLIATSNFWEAQAIIINSFASLVVTYFVFLFSLYAYKKIVKE